MWICEKCKEYRSVRVTTCHCKAFCIIDEDGEEYELQAMDEQGAALKYAEESNCQNDYYLMNESVEITVNGKEFAISAEPDIHYSADAK